MVNPMSIVNKCLGRVPQVPKLGKPSIKPARDTFSQNMVRYNYFEVDLDNGQKEIMYGGSIASVRRQLEDQGKKWVQLKELPYGEVQTKTTEDQRNSLRGKTKSIYSNRGMKKINV